MKYSVAQYLEYFGYLLGFESPAICVGNTIMQDDSYDFLFIDKNFDSSKLNESKLLEDLMDEHEDIQFFNDDIDVKTIHEFFKKVIRDKKLDKLLN